jgi:hypothetical protein
MAITPTTDGSSIIVYVNEVLESRYIVSDDDDWHGIIDAWRINAFSSNPPNVTMVYGFDQIEVFVYYALCATPIEMCYPNIPTQTDPNAINIAFPTPTADNQYLAYVRTTTYSEFDVAVTIDSLTDLIPTLNPLNTSFPSYVTLKTLRSTPQPRLMVLNQVVGGLEVRSLTVQY